jgi:hypothetical protein
LKAHHLYQLTLADITYNSPRVFSQFADGYNMDITITKDNLQNYPLVKYAARHWVEHARFENILEFMEDGMKELFDPRRRCLEIWVWICDPWSPLAGLERAERPSPPEGTTLHYAAVCGLHGVAKFLVVELSQDVDSQAFDEELTSLHVASAYGHMEVTCILVEHGVDATAEDNNKNTPLHVASTNGHVDVACVLLKHGIDMTTHNRDGKTPLHEASAEGHLEVTRLLIDHGVDPIAHKGSSGLKETPLHMASIHGHVEVAHFLVEHGVDTETKTSLG